MLLMKQELEQKLYSDFPKLFAQKDAGMSDGAGGGDGGGDGGGGE